MNIILQVAAGDLFSGAQTLITKFSHLGAAVLALVVAVLAAGHVAKHSPGAAIVVVIIALIPAWFLLDPNGAINMMKSTVSGL